MNNCVPVVFCFDSRIVLGASVSIKSLIDCAKETTTYDIRILHSDLDLDNQKALNSLVENTRHNIAFHYVNPDKFKHAPHNNKSWTELVYYRLLIPEILNEYDKAVYADVDVLFKGDLAEIYNEDISDYECSAVAMEPNNDKMICHKYFPENKNELTFISSFIVFNCKRMRVENFVKRVYKTIEIFGNRLKFYDLDTLNITCNKIKPIPYRYGVFQSIYYSDDLNKSVEYSFLKNVYSDEELLKEKANTIMLHYAGEPGKPWRRKHVPEDYQRCLDTIPKSLKRYTFRDFRKKLFSKV